MDACGGGANTAMRQGYLILHDVSHHVVLGVAYSGPVGRPLSMDPARGTRVEWWAEVAAGKWVIVYDMMGHQQLERERAQSGHRATVAPSTTPSVDEAEQIADDGQYKFLLAWRLRMCVAARAVMTAHCNDCRTLVEGDDRPAAAACGRGVCRESNGCVGGSGCC
jgi:hypothetical protein